MTLILASQSPRRREILNYFSLPFDVLPSDYDEESLPFDGDPKAYVITLARNKALALAEKYPTRHILAADTTVYLKGKIYGKPKDEASARTMLQELSGNTHSVFTGVAVRVGHQEFFDVEETKITFHNLTEKQQHTYHRFCYGLDKAGGYAIQEAGGIIVKGIQGCFYNVMGLPLNTVCNLLQQSGIDLWDHLSNATLP